MRGEGGAGLGRGRRQGVGWGEGVGHAPSGMWQMVVEGGVCGVYAEMADAERAVPCNVCCSSCTLCRSSTVCQGAELQPRAHAEAICA